MMYMTNEGLFSSPNRFGIVTTPQKCCGTVIRPSWQRASAQYMSGMNTRRKKTLTQMQKKTGRRFPNMHLALCATSGQHSVDNKPSAVDRCMHSLSAADALFYGFWMMANLVGAIGRECSFFFQLAQVFSCCTPSQFKFFRTQVQPPYAALSRAVALELAYARLRSDSRPCACFGQLWS